MATNKINGKQYIGQTINSLEQRKGEHTRCSSLNNDNYHFHNALRKHGTESFEWVILDECDELDTLNRLEIHYIKLYNTFEKGMNLTLGGGGHFGFKHSEESKLLMSLAKKGRKPSEATIMGRRNTKVSEETKRKISNSLKGKNNNWRGRKHSKETLKKISGKNNHGSRAVVVNGKYFPTLTVAAEYLGVVKTTISNRVKRKVKGYSCV